MIHMSKIFITERDVDEMKSRGITSIDVTDDVVMTDLAVERALKYGMQLNRMQSAPPAARFSPSVNTLDSNLIQARPSSEDTEVIAKVKAAVLARLDGQVDATLLDAVISRIVAAMR